MFKGICMVRLVLWIVSFFVLASSGCGTTKAVIRKISPGDSQLKKRVMVLPFLDQAGLEAAKIEAIHSNFVGHLKNSSGLILYPPPPGMSGTQGLTPSLLGIVTSPSLVKKAGEMGLNALISGVISPIDVTTKKKGIWPFRSIKRFYEVSLVVNVVDVTGGTLYLSHMESKRMTVPVEEAESGIDPDTADQMFAEALPTLLKRQASIVVNNLARQPWSGRILSVNGDTLVISAGKDVGASPGQHFEVFARGDLISSKGGGSFHALGRKVGEVQITSVMKDRALAVPLEGGRFLQAQRVMSKH